MANNADETNAKKMSIIGQAIKQNVKNIKRALVKLIRFRSTDLSKRQIKSKVGMCLLCKTENVQLTKAHLISKALLEFLNKQSFQYTVDGSDKVANMNESWFDYILCQKCNGEKLAPHEAVLKKYLAVHRNPYDNELSSKLRSFLEEKKQSPEALYSHITIAILSFFWQFHVAQLKHRKNEPIKFFKHAINTEALEKIRLMILNQNIREFEDFHINIEYCVPKKRLQTSSYQENRWLKNEIRIDMFSFGLILPHSDQIYPEKVLSPENCLQPFDAAAFSLGDMRNAILNKLDTPFINNLFETGKNDVREFNSTPAHPIRILKELIAIAPIRQEDHYKTIIDALLELFKNPIYIAQSKHSPLDVLKEFLSPNMWHLTDHIDSDTRLENKLAKNSMKMLTELQYFSLRKKIFEFSVAQLLSSENKTKSYQAADFICDCINYEENELPIQRQVNKEAIAVFTKIKEILEKEKLSVPVITRVFMKIEDILNYAYVRDTQIIDLLYADLIETQMGGLDEKIIYLLVKRHNAPKVHPSLDRSIEIKTAKELAGEIFATYPFAQEQTKYLKTLYVQIKSSIHDFSAMHLACFYSELDRLGASADRKSDHDV